ncbi:hypothetical protein EJ04DRAFT_512651 [Polyplosphaeria fusca]|uniref:Uncharacterized protein n=1 Tax=Polyplosphaeria fusca TaxID=682080 RepID=A0A9P4V2L3_9PLEO|nr:hypothetical protein EJ04DRAFT_512651 [Polyplosphaeria fusca]
MSSDNVIDHFMKEWKQKKPYYEILAKSAWEMCKEALEKEGIKAEAKWRVKDNEQLRAKCVTRSQTKPYANPEEIFEDIADLAGVRLALYFPNQITNVAHMIDRTFQVEKVKKHKGQEPGEQEDPNDRFSRGYFAEYVSTKPKISAPA